MPSEGIAKPKGPMEATSKGGQRSSLWVVQKYLPTKGPMEATKCKEGLQRALPTGPNLGLVKPRGLTGPQNRGRLKKRLPPNLYLPRVGAAPFVIM
jgi:hypothetical protein